MSVILRNPEMAPEKRMLGAQRKSAQDASPKQRGPTEAPAETLAAEHLEFGLSEESNQQLEKRLHDTQAAVHQAGLQAYDEGYQVGHETGIRTGEAEGREAYVSGLRQLEALTQNLDRTVQRGLDESEDTMVAIVYESVCKIVGEALASREGVVAVVREALGRVRGKSSVIIRVNPFDLELIEESTAFGVASEADWRADESIPMGGCVIESEYGTLDARIDTQLNQLKRVLLAARHRPADVAEIKRAD